MNRNTRDPAHDDSLSLEVLEALVGAAGIDRKQELTAEQAAAMTAGAHEAPLVSTNDPGLPPNQITESKNMSAGEYSAKSRLDALTAKYVGAIAQMDDLPAHFYKLKKNIVEAINDVPAAKSAASATQSEHSAESLLHKAAAAEVANIAHMEQLHATNIEMRKHILKVAESKNMPAGEPLAKDSAKSPADPKDRLAAMMAKVDELDARER